MYFVTTHSLTLSALRMSVTWIVHKYTENDSTVPEESRAKVEDDEERRRQEDEAGGCRAPAVAVRPLHGWQDRLRHCGGVIFTALGRSRVAGRPLRSMSRHLSGEIDPFWNLVLIDGVFLFFSQVGGVTTYTEPDYRNPERNVLLPQCRCHVQSVRFVVRKVLRCPLLFTPELSLALRVKTNYWPWRNKNKYFNELLLVFPTSNR